MKQPEIRFNGFSDEWVEKKLGEITDRFDSDRKAVAASNRTKGDIPYYGAVGIQGYINGYTHNGDYLLIAEDGASSMLGYPVRVVSGKIWVNNHAHVLAALNNVADNNYLRTTLSTIDMTPYVTGGSRHKLTAGDLVTIKIQLPSLPEQQKIGALFSKYDAIISLREQKLAELNALKKGMLQQMFDDGVATSHKPQVRFSGFKDEWVEKKLGNLSSITTGKLDANAMSKDGKYDFYTSGIKKYRINEYAFEGQSITIAGNGANVGYMHMADGKFNAYQRTYVLQNFKADREFLYFGINRKLPRKIFQESRTGSIPYIVIDMLISLTLMMPSLPEQQKIGQLFKHLDARISNEQSKIEQLKAQKQGLLQKML